MRLVEDWKEELTRLEADIRVWSEEEGWTVRQDKWFAEETSVGLYETKQIAVFSDIEELDDNPVRFIPRGRMVIGAEGCIDIESPSGRFTMLKTDGTWNILTIGGFPIFEGWSRESFVAFVGRVFRFATA